MVGEDQSFKDEIVTEIQKVSLRKSRNSFQVAKENWQLKYEAEPIIGCGYQSLAEKEI